MFNKITKKAAQKLDNELIEVIDSLNKL